MPYSYHMKTTKQCFKCNETKPLSEFYKHKEMADGHLGKCKSCTKNDVTANRAENIDAYLAYDKSRSNLPHRVEARREYVKTDAGKESRRKSHKNYKERYPERARAHNKLSNAVRDGKLIRPDSCEVCGERCKPHGHHWSYEEENWLDVEWVCINCHIDIHNEIRGA